MGKLVENGRIGIPNEYFLKMAKHDYSNFREALAREFYQNSIDAGATTILVTSDEESRTIVVTDDGCGMDLDVITEKLLFLGGSFKQSDDAAGAFGKAKEILFFSWISYEIHTHNFLITGAGDRFDITEIDEFQEGTKVSILIQKEEDFDWLVREFTDVAEKIETDTSIQVNGKNIYTISPKGNFLKTIPDVGDLYMDTENGWDESISVRINGIWMHNWYIGETLKNAEAKLTLELNQKSLEFLTSNRDGMKWEPKRKAEKFLEEIMLDRVSTLKPDTVEIVATVPGEDDAEIREEDVDEIFNEVHWNKVSPELLKMMAKIALQQGLDPKLTTSRITTGIDDDMDFGDKESFLKFVGYKSSFLTKCEKGDLTEMRKFLTTKRARTLASMWTETIKQVLLDNHIYGRFSTGFMTGESLASYTSEKDSTIVSRDEQGEFEFSGTIKNKKVFLLHPYKIFEKYSLSNRKILGLKIKQIAIHEVTHFYEGYHHESYSSKREAVEENTWKSGRIYDKITKLKK